MILENEDNGKWQESNNSYSKYIEELGSYWSKLINGGGQTLKLYPRG